MGSHWTKQSRRLWAPCLIFAALLLILGNAYAATWSHDVSGEYDIWYLDGAQKFQYHLTNQQWWHYSTTNSTWYVLSATGMPDTNFCETGAWYDLGTGLKYRYDTGLNFGFFSKGAGYRFYYRYSPGQWYTSGYGGGWYLLGAAVRSAGLVDGNWYDLGTGLHYRYDASYDFGYFRRGGANRFYYRYAPGQWYTSGYGGGWYLSGATGRSAAMVDGNWYDLGIGLNFQYNVTFDFGYYKRSSQWRFYYRYVSGEWYTSGYGGGWHMAAPLPLSAAFIGDGNWYDLVAGHTYRYDAAYDFSYFKRNDQWRFHYRYASGDWYTSGYGGGWYQLGMSGRQPGLWGSGYLGNGWWFSYWTATDHGLYSLVLPTYGRFYYQYATGQWNHTTWGAWDRDGWIGGWHVLGSTGTSAAFVGDGNPHDIGDGWTYRYSGGTGQDGDGYFSLSDGERFYLDYTWSDSFSGWWVRNPHIPTGNWQPLGGYSAAFIGNGQWHNVGDDLVAYGKFQYDKASDYAYFATPSGQYRFRYDYGLGQWYHTGNAVNWCTLGGQGIDFAVNPIMGMYDTNGLYYQYSGYDYGDKGEWNNGGIDVILPPGPGYVMFEYDYATGTWTGTLLGTSGSGLPAKLIADGSRHSLGNGWEYMYFLAPPYFQMGYFYKPGDVRYTYAIDYYVGQWYHSRPNDSRYNLGWASPDTEYSYWDFEFIGDGNAHKVVMNNGDLSTSWWYRRSGDCGYWHHLSDSYEKYQYNYATGEWFRRTSPTSSWERFYGPDVDPVYNPGVDLF